VHVVYRSSEPEYVELRSLIRENIIAGAVCTFIGAVFTFIVGLIGLRIIKMKKAEQEEELKKQLNFKL
jgi:hypothetical protein